MKNLITIGAALFCTLSIFGQADKMQWSENNQIKEASFKALPPVSPNDNTEEYLLAAHLDFNFQMLNLQFAFTKNFNSYVDVYYVPSQSWMEKGQYTEQFLGMANLDFDLIELYARKFRKKMFEAKKVGSSMDFYTKLHNDNNFEYNNERYKIQSELRSSDNPIVYIQEKNAEINEGILELAEFCKSCKPTKKKK